MADLSQFRDSKIKPFIKIKKSKITSIGGTFLITLFFIGYHIQKNEEQAQARANVYQAQKEFNDDIAQMEELLKKTRDLKVTLNEGREKFSIPTENNINPIQSTRQKRGQYFAGHQRKINDLPRDLGGGIVYVNCTYEEDKNILIFHYMLSFDFNGNISAEGYDTMIQQMKRTPDWEETESFGFTDIQAYWNMPTRLVQYSLLNEKWL